jgi:hypothetical protein
MTSDDTWCRLTVRAPGPPDLAAVDALAWLQLAAARAGGAVEMSELSSELLELLELVGLRGQMCRQAERREDRLGVEEEAERGDPAG